MPTIANIGPEHVPKTQGRLDVSGFPMAFTGQFSGVGEVALNIPGRVYDEANWLTVRGAQYQDAYIHSGHDEHRLQPFFGRPSSGHVVPEVIIYSEDYRSRVPSTHVETTPGKHAWSKPINTIVTTYSSAPFRFGQALQTLRYKTDSYTPEELDDKVATITYGVAAITPEQDNDFYIRGEAAEHRDGVSQATTVLVPKKLGRSILDLVLENPRVARDIAAYAIGSFLVHAYQDDYRSFLLPNFQGIDATIQDTPAYCGLVTISEQSNSVRSYIDYPTER